MSWLMRKRRWLVTGVVAMLFIMAAVVVGTGWYISGMLRDGALKVNHDPGALDLEVMEIDEASITLFATELAEDDGAWTKDGLWGMEWEEGYGHVGDILSQDGRTVVRTYEPVSGTLAAGAQVRLDSFWLEGDPQQALGKDFQEVTYMSELGEYPAWLLPGDRATWAIFVHGWRADREESLRILPSLVDLGYPSLVITYRNDEGTPHSPDGFYRFGATEWKDLESAVQYALDHGAQDVVLVGYSMGGATVANFLLDSDLAGKVRAVVFDSPILSFGALVDYNASITGVPAPLANLGQIFAAWRFDIDWSAQDYLRRADEFTVPILIFHGDDDRRVHISTSKAFAKALPDLVMFVPVQGATHVRSWNIDPEQYEAIVRTFLNAQAQ